MNNKNTVRKITICGVFAAIICVISFLPIRTLGLEITLSMVPVAIGATVFGPAIGSVLGGVFGVISFIQCFGFSPFGATLLSINAFYTALVCIPTRILAGFLAGVVAKAAAKKETLSLVLGSILAPVLNTVFFMSALCLAFYNTEYIQGFVSVLGAVNPIMFILLFVGINGLVEIIAGAVIALPAAKAVKHSIK